jgi:hypothetical protein
LSGVISVGDLTATISAELENYNREVIKGTKDEAKKAMDRLVKDTKATAPVGRRKKHYKNSITSRKEWENDLGIQYTWYVKGADYRLSHLLENGHATRNGGRTRATHFIKNASDPILEDYVKAVEEVCKNG